MIHYYINLDRALERRRHMEAEGRRLGIEFKRLEALDGSIPDTEILDQFRANPSLIHSMRPMEVACTLSHRKAWELIANSGENYGVVLEDDLSFSRDTAEILATEDWIPRDADIVKLETFNRKTRLSPPAVDIRTGRQLWCLAGTHLGAGGYILSRDHAKRLVQATVQILLPADYLLFNMETWIVPTNKIYQLTPAICVQQQRTSRRFLPKGAKTSYVYKNQSTRRNFNTSKAIREIVRPFRQIRHDVVNRAWALRFGGYWGKVIFVD